MCNIPEQYDRELDPTDDTDCIFNTTRFEDAVEAALEHIYYNENERDANRASVTQALRSVTYCHCDRCLSEN